MQENARDAWANLAALQAQMIELGAADPWSFWAAIKQFHEALAATFDDYGSRKLRMPSDLAFGPWGLTEDGESDWSRRAEGWIEPSLSSDDEARREWDLWANDSREWDESTWPYWRFVRGLDAREPFAGLWAYRVKEQRRERPDQPDPLSFVEKHAQELERYVAGELDKSAMVLE